MNTLQGHLSQVIDSFFVDPCRAPIAGKPHHPLTVRKMQPGFIVFARVKRDRRTWERVGVAHTNYCAIRLADMACWHFAKYRRGTGVPLGMRISETESEAEILTEPKVAHYLRDLEALFLEHKIVSLPEPPPPVHRHDSVVSVRQSLKDTQSQVALLDAEMEKLAQGQSAQAQAFLALRAQFTELEKQVGVMVNHQLLLERKMERAKYEQRKEQ